jgi:hypothetical protein
VAPGKDNPEAEPVPAPPDPDDAAWTGSGDAATGSGSTGGQSPLSVPSNGDGFSEHPELLVGAAFIGGFAMAQLLKRFGG